MLEVLAVKLLLSYYRHIEITPEEELDKLSKKRRKLDLYNLDYYKDYQNKNLKV